jgi:hypothetical protein
VVKDQGIWETCGFAKEHARTAESPISPDSGFAENPNATVKPITPAIMKFRHFARLVRPGANSETTAGPPPPDCRSMMQRPHRRRKDIDKELEQLAGSKKKDDE